MTITTKPVRNEYTATAGQTVFNYTYKIYENDNLEVYITPSGQEADDDTDLTTNYTVDPNTIGNEDGGFITFNSPLSAGDKVTIISDIPLDRTVDYQNNGDFRPTTVNNDNDRQVSQIKQLAELAGRTLTFQQSAQNQTGLTIPDPIASQFLRWKSDLSGLENVTISNDASTADGSLFMFPNAGAMAAATSTDIQLGNTLVCQGYHSAGVGPALIGVVVAAGTGVVDGGKFIDLPNTTPALQWQQIFESNGVTVEQWGAKGDGATDDTAAINAALNSGFTGVYFGDGRNYSVTQLAATNPVLRTMDCFGRCQITSVASASSTALSISTRQFFKLDNIFFLSDGDKLDGLFTTGVRFETSCSLIETGQGLQIQGYSHRGLNILQCVAATINNFTGNNGGVCLALEKNAGIPCTTVVINQPYIFGGRRGIWSDGCVNLTLVQPVFEGSGEPVDNDAALHISGGVCNMIDPYWETNQRNYIFDDAFVNWTGTGVEFTAVAPNVVVYQGAAEPMRGIGRFTNTDLNIRRIGPDNLAQKDLVIGENLTAPFVGGSVQHGNNQTRTLTGVATNGVWTPIYILEGQNTIANDQVTYDYTIATGFSDLFTGYSSGRVYNGTLYAFGEAVPAWLRLNVNQIEVFITSSSYGLGWALILNETTPIT